MRFAHGTSPSSWKYRSRTLLATGEPSLFRLTGLAPVPSAPPTATQMGHNASFPTTNQPGSVQPVATWTGSGHLTKKHKANSRSAGLRDSNAPPKPGTPTKAGVHIQRSLVSSSAFNAVP